MGVFGLILMFAPAIGPTLSGWIIEHYDWRMLFHFITPIAIVILVIGFFLLKDKKEKVDMRLDFVSLLLSSIGFGGILYGFSSAGSKGWDSPLVYLTIAVGVISLIVFILRQIKQEQPLLNFSVYQYPMFALVFGHFDGFKYGSVFRNAASSYLCSKHSGYFSYGCRSFAFARSVIDVDHVAFNRKII